MQIMTKVFGEITVDDDKMIHFPKGIIGFPDLKDFALIHDEDNRGRVAYCTRWQTR